MPFGDVVRAESGDADTQIHGVPVLHLAGDSSGDDFTFGRGAHPVALRTVRFSIRFSYCVP